MNKTFGRVAITGLHSVVFGKPAITSSINLGVTAKLATKSGGDNDEYIQSVLDFLAHEKQLDCQDLLVEIDSQIPVGSGLSSSTAVAASVIKLAFELSQTPLSKEDLFKVLVAFESQKYPVSGMDQSAIAFGGIQIFQKRPEENYRKFVAKSSLHGQTLLLIDSGNPQETTAELVNMVIAKRKDNPEKINQILEAMGEISNQIIQSLDQSSFRFDLWSKTQQYFEQLGVVGLTARDIVTKIEKSGGFAKLSGAGGVSTGSGILLAFHREPEKLEYLIKHNNWQYWKVKLAE